MQIFLLERNDSKDGWLGAAETKHCIKVLRHQNGDKIFCIDGRGTAFEAQIIQHTKEETQLKLLQSMPQWGEHQHNIRLAVSPLRLKDRFEFLIEKAVELGVNEIFPLSCKRTDKYQAKFKKERIETRILAATKQCKRSHIATLHPLQPIEQFLSDSPAGAHFIAYCGEQAMPLQNQAAQIKVANTLTLLIGPEGDFTEEEVRFAERENYQSVSLGENRLRTETAALYGLGIIKMLLEY